MRIYLDTEFIEDGRTIELLSIGMVSESGQSPLYLESSDADLSKASPWVRKNVLRHLDGNGIPRAVIAQEIRRWVGPQPEFWGYYCDYDWVVFCRLFGTMQELPKGWPMYCRDLKQLADSLGLELSSQDGTEHHALADARWIRKKHELILEKRFHEL